MHSPRSFDASANLSRLRAAVATIERDLSRLPPSAGRDPADPIGSLRASIAVLLDELALGPEPKLRECPSCHHFGRWAAVRCGYCWTRLVPSENAGESASPAGFRAAS